MGRFITEACRKSMSSACSTSRSRVIAASASVSEGIPTRTYTTVAIPASCRLRRMGPTRSRRRPFADEVEQALAPALQAELERFAAAAREPATQIRFEELLLEADEAVPSWRWGLGDDLREPTQRGRRERAVGQMDVTSAGLVPQRREARGELGAGQRREALGLLQRLGAEGALAPVAPPGNSAPPGPGSARGSGRAADRRSRAAGSGGPGGSAWEEPPRARLPGGGRPRDPRGRPRARPPRPRRRRRRPARRRSRGGGPRSQAPPPRR